MAFVDVTDPNYKPGETPSSGFVDVTDPNYKPPPPRGAVAEVGTAIKRGAIVDLPTMIGQGMQYVSSAGQPLYEMGKGLAEKAQARGEFSDVTLHPEEHGAVVNALAAGGQMLPSILAPAGLAAAGAAALPAAVPALATTAAVAGATAVPFALQAGQQTLEKGKAAGVPEDQATTAARLNAGLTFGTQMGLGMVGGQLLGKIPTLFGNVVKKEGADLAAKTLSDLAGQGGLLGPFAKSVATSGAEATLVGGAQAAGSAAIERAYGVDTTSPWDAAVAQAPAMLGLTALMSPIGLAGRAVRLNALAKRAEALSSKDTSPQIRDQLATQYFTELNKVDPASAREFAINADTAIKNKMPLQIDPGLFQQGTVQAPAAPPTPEVRALPAPEGMPALAPPEARAQLEQTMTEARAGETPEAAAARDAAVRAAQENADRIQRERAAYENRQRLEEVHGQIIDELQKAGVEPTRGMTFPEFRDAIIAEAKKSGLKASDLTQHDFEDMWQKHQDDVRASNFAKAQKHAFQLAEETRTKLPTSAGEEPRSALAVALDDALKHAQLDEAFKQHEQAQAAQKEAQLTAMQNVQRGSELAAAAARGEVPPTAATLPSRAESFVQALRDTREQGQAMPPKLMKELTKAVEGKKSLEEQLAAVRALRDSKSPESASYELLDRMHTELGGQDASQERGATGVAGNAPAGSAAQVAEGGPRGSKQAAAARQEGTGQEGNGEKAVTKRGRPEGTTDDRHTIGPPNEVGELLPYTRPLSEARASGIFGEKQWWQDLAWAVRNPETKIGKELLENGKVTDAQVAEALARDERYTKADALLEKMRSEREQRVRDMLLAEEQPEKAKEILKAKDLVNIFGGDESDYTFEKKAATPGDDQRVRNIFASAAAHHVSDILDALQKISTDPAQKAFIEKLRALGLNTTLSMVDRDLRQGRSAGLYNEIADHVLIGKGGADIETVLHEIAHAATLKNLDEGIAILTNVNTGKVKLRDLSPEQRRLMSAADDLLNVFLDATERQGEERHYGLSEPREFVAEALTNGRFQDFLRRGGATENLWTRFVNFVKKMLGINMSSELLDRALSSSESFLGNNGHNRPMPTEETLPGLQRFVEGPTSAAKQTDSVFDQISKMGDVGLSLKQGFTKAHMYAASLNHLRQVFKNLLPGDNKTALDDLGNAQDRTKAMVEERNREALEISRQMFSLADKQPGLDQKLYRLMGEATRQGIFPDRKLEEQPWKAKESPDKVRKYNELRNIYNSNEDLRKAYDAAAQYNKTDYDRIYATLVRNLARYSEMPTELWKGIDVTKGRSTEVQALEKWLLEKGSDEQRIAMRGALAQYREKQAGPYFHLGRNGSYFSRFTIADNPAARAAFDKAFGTSTLATDRVMTADDRHVFARFENADEWKMTQQKLNALRDAGHLEPDMQAGQLETMLHSLDSSSPAFIRGLLRNIEADSRLDPEQKAQSQEILRRLAVEMLPETSASKAFAQRKGVAGYDVDMNRSFVKRAAATAYFIAHNSIRPEVEDAMLKVKEGVKALQDATSPHYDNDRGLVASALQDELKRRQANDMMPLRTPALDVVSALSHSFYLALNPAFFMMKTLQPWQLALPQLGARHGFVKSFGAMTKATATALGIIKDTIGQGWQRDQWHGVLDPDIVIDKSRATQSEKAFLKELIAAGGATFTQAHDMGRIAEGEAQGVSTVVKAANASLHYSEAVDRMTAGLAAFNLEMKRSGGDFDKSTQYAIQMVKNSLYDYNSHNRGRAFTKQGVFGPATPLLTQFAQYQIQTLELLGRLTTDSFGKVSPDMSPAERTAALEQRAEARKALAGIMATTMVLAGTMGLPGATVIQAAYNALFSTKDNPADAYTDYRNFLADTFGKEMGEIIAHGGIRLAGSDLGSRLGFQDIVPFSRFLADRRKLQDRFDDGALSMMGPSVGALSGFAFGAQNMLQGRYLKGLAQMMPSGLKGPVKAFDMAENGVTDLRGNKLPIDVNSWDVFGQALNSTPAKIAEQRAAQHSANTTSMLLQLRASSLKENFAVAVERGNSGEMKDLLDEITAFNRQNPDYAVRDLTGILRQRAVARAIAEQSGATGSARQLPRLRENQRFANIGGMP